MRPVLCFGEVLIDFLNTSRKQDGDLALNSFTQYPGGAPANVAVAVARLGGESRFAGQVGADPFGEFLLNALELFGVDTTFTAIHGEAKTALAFVFLDDDGERSFSFRRDGTADVVMQPDQVVDEWFERQPIVHLCSNTLTDPSITRVTREVVTRARDRAALVSFDVNLRHNLWPTGQADPDTVNEQVMNADLVKFAREEFDFLSQGDPGAYRDQCFAARPSVLLITDGGKDLRVVTERGDIGVTPPQVKAVDTTGAGDAFIAGVLFGLSRSEDPVARMTDPEYIEELVRFAAHCGAVAVTRPGAFPSFPRLDDVNCPAPRA